MKIKNVRHTGIVVRDLEESLKFYSGFLGLEVWRRTTEVLYQASWG
jgi:catechol 2,3-dioxygenase-like lactoylglutathione lyase family enzyme